MEVRTDKLRFFRTQAELRRWFEKKHGSEQEVWIGFYRSAKGPADCAVYPCRKAQEAQLT